MTRPRQHKNTRGTALLYALGLMFILSVGLTASWRYLMVTTDYGVDTARQTQVRQLAESGAYAAISALAQGETSREIPPTPFGRGLYTATIAPQPEANTYIVRAEGRLGDAPPHAASHALEVELVLDGGGGFQILRWGKGAQP